MNPERNPEDVLRELREPQHWQGLRTPRAGRSGRTAVGLAPARVLPAVAALVIAVLAVTGIGVGFGSLRHEGAVPAVSPSSSLSAAAAAPQAFSGVVAGDSDDFVGWVSRPPAPTCESDRIDLESEQDGGLGMGTYRQRIFLRNDGVDCVLKGAKLQVGSRTLDIASQLLPAAALLYVEVGTGGTCGSDGAVENIRESGTTEQMTFLVGARRVKLAARFPTTHCSPAAILATFFDPDDEDRFPSSVSALRATVDVPQKTPPGRLVYDATLQNTGASALRFSRCPSFTEVLADGNGNTVVRHLSLQCAADAVLQASEQVTLHVPVSIQRAGQWSVSWFLDDGAATSSASTTCALSQLRVSEAGPGYAKAGDFTQLITVVNSGSECTVPVTAFAAGGRFAAAPAGGPGSITVQRGPSKVAVEAPITCADGSANIDSAPLDKYHEKAISLGLGGNFADGLDQLFPTLHCAGPSAYRAG